MAEVSSVVEVVSKRQICKAGFVRHYSTSVLPPWITSLRHLRGWTRRASTAPNKGDPDLSAYGQLASRTAPVGSDENREYRTISRDRGSTTRSQ